MNSGLCRPWSTPASLALAVVGLAAALVSPASAWAQPSKPMTAPPASAPADPAPAAPAPATPAQPPAAGSIALNAALTPGREFVYTYVIDQTYSSVTNPPSPNVPPRQRIQRHEVDLKFKVSAVGKDLATVDMAVVRHTVRIESEQGIVNLDLSKPAPTDNKQAAEYHKALSGLLSAKIQFDVAVRTGKITAIRGADEVMKTSGRIMRRFLELGCISPIFGSIFSLRPDANAASVGETWPVDQSVYGDRWSQATSEIRKLDAVEGSLVKVSGRISETSKPALQQGSAVYFKDALGTMSYVLDTQATGGPALRSLVRDENITFVMTNPDNSRNEMTTATKSTLTLAPASPGKN